jgi:hypothetical protein
MAARVRSRSVTHGAAFSFRRSTSAASKGPRETRGPCPARLEVLPHVGGCAGHASRGDGMVFGVKLDADIAPLQHLRRQQRRAGTGKGVKHYARLRTERFHQRQQHRNRLLRRMQAVAAIRPVDNIAYRPVRAFRVALGQQIGIFMLTAQEAGARRVALRERDVTGEAEPGLTPRADERIRARPAVEADAKNCRVP